MNFENITSDSKSSFSPFQLISPQIESARWSLTDNVMIWTPGLFSLHKIIPTKDFLISKNSWLELIVEEDRERAEELFNSNSFSGEVCVNTSDGVKHFHIWSSIVDKQKVVATFQDITGIKEFLNRTEEEHLEHISNSVAEEVSHSAHWRYSFKKKKYFLSDYLFSLLNIEKSEEIDLIEEIKKRLHPEDLTTFENFNPENVDDFFRYHFRILNNEFDIRYFRIKGKTITYRGEKYLAGLIREITDDVKSKIILERENSILEALIDNSTGMFLAVDNEKRIIAWNKTAEEISGKRKEEVLGMVVTEFYSDPIYNERNTLLEKALQGESEELIGQPFFDREGFGDFFFRPLKNSKDQIIGAIILMYDRTEQILLAKELEKRTQLAEMILNNSVDTIAVFGIDFTILNVNRATEIRFGKSREEIVGKKLTEAFPYLEGSDRLIDLQRAFSGEFIHHKCIPFNDGSGYHENFIVPMRDENNVITGAIAIAHDITALVNTEEEQRLLNKKLEDQNQLLRQTNEELQSFTYIASHDLQEPLRKIQTFATRILDKEQAVLSETGKDYFRRMYSSARRMQQLIQDLLSFSRIGTVEKKFTPTNLNSVLEKARSSFRELIEERSAVITSEALPVVNAIDWQVTQLFENIISNALKYTHPLRTPVITITKEIVEDDAENKKYLRVNFSDNGIGFDQQYATRIFGMFQRLFGRGEFPGTGLGLSICKRIMENHNGRICATGKPDEGSVFSIDFPIEHNHK